MRDKIMVYLGNIVIVLLVIFGLFISYQIALLLIGGSWESEDIIVSLLFFNLGAVFTIGLMLATMVSDHKHLNQRFNYLAKDFKEHIRKHEKTKHYQKGIRLHQNARRHGVV